MRPSRTEFFKARERARNDRYAFNHTPQMDEMWHDYAEENERINTKLNAKRDAVYEKINALQDELRAAEKEAEAESKFAQEKWQVARNSKAMLALEEEMTGESSREMKRLKEEMLAAGWTEKELR